MEQQYRIGDVSRKLGISRDTLRFNEKKGVIKPEKLDNGYRYYSYKDVRILLDIMFFRKYDFSLEEIYDMLNTSTYDSISEKIQKKIEEQTLELCYIYDEYELADGQARIKGQYMVIPAPAVSGLELKAKVVSGRRIHYGDCVYTVVEADSYSPAPAQIAPAVEWAKNQGLCLAGHVYAGHLLHCAKEGCHVYYVELYLPIV